MADIAIESDQSLVLSYDYQKDILEIKYEGHDNLTMRFSDEQVFTLAVFLDRIRTIREENAR